MPASATELVATSFEAAHREVLRLVTNFRQGEHIYTSSDYSESQARLDFIDKFWTLLGWDVSHDHQINPYEQEVKVERNVSDSGRGRRADYAFLHPNFRDVRFFVEAKRPGAPLDTPDNFFQVIRYGWNSHVPISILTNFLEFRVLDCRYKPDIASRIIHLVDKVIEAKEQLHSAKTEQQQMLMTAKFESFDRQIDALIYEAYKLSSGEIEAVEQG